MWSIARSSNPNDEAVELTGTREEKLAEVRASFGENFVTVYSSITLIEGLGVVFFPTEAQAWPWIARMLASGGCARDFHLYDSHGVKLGTANNHWDEITLAEFNLHRDHSSPEEFLKSLPVAEPNRLGLPQRDHNAEATAARVAELNTLFYARCAADAEAK